MTQVGQGGYGQVFLAEHKETKEVCALKVMSKKLLFKLDEIRHVLTERDILTAAKSDWLVKLLYAFQDDQSIYLAMVTTALSHGERALDSDELNRNTYLVVILELYSTIQEFCISTMPGFTLQRCLLPSTPYMIWGTFTAISNPRISLSIHLGISNSPILV